MTGPSFYTHLHIRRPMSYDRHIPKMAKYIPVNGPSRDTTVRIV